MCHNLDSILEAKNLYSQVISRFHQSRRSISSSDFGSDAIIQQVHCLSEAFGGELFDVIDRNENGYNVSFSPEALVFIIKLMRDSIQLIDLSLNAQIGVAKKYAETKAIANKILNHNIQEDEDYPSADEMVLQGQGSVLEEILVENMVEMNPLEQEEVFENYSKNLIRKIDADNDLRIFNLLRDIIDRNIEPRLTKSNQTREKALSDKPLSVSAQVGTKSMGIKTSEIKGSNSKIVRFPPRNL